jgi:hypothetical protein
MTWTFFSKFMPVATGSALATAAFAATALATSAPTWASCVDAAAAEQCVAACPDDQELDAGSGECRAKTNQAAVVANPNQSPEAANQIPAAAEQAPEAPLKAAWENAFGPLPKPEDFALARVDDPTIAMPSVGLPGVGVNLLNIAPSAAAGAASALPTIAVLQAQPALPAPPPLPGPPPMPCVGFATPIPFVGFSTC